MMDVLEHVQNDREFLASALNALPDGGNVLVTVPAFQFLFSDHDVFLKHYRRYDRKSLMKLLTDSGLAIEQCHYFYTSLFFARFLLGFFKKKHNGIGGWRFHERHIITKMIYWALNVDFAMCGLFARFHIYLPGLSLLAVCKKGQV
jgi:hypothetical protein